MFTTILTNELHAAFTLVDAGEFPVWIKHQVHQVELCVAQLAFRGFVAFVDQFVEEHWCKGNGSLGEVLIIFGFYDKFGLILIDKRL